MVYQRNETNQQGYPFREVAVMVRRSIIHQPVDFVPYDSFTALGVDIRVADGDLWLYAIYRPPANRTTNLKADLRALFQHPTPTILAGDWNTKHVAWNASRIDQPGRVIYSAAVDYNFDISRPEEPTHYDDAGPATSSTL